MNKLRQGQYPRKMYNKPIMSWRGLIESLKSAKPNNRIDCSGANCYGSEKYFEEIKVGRRVTHFVFITSPASRTDDLRVGGTYGVDAEHNLRKQTQGRKVVWYEEISALMNAGRRLEELERFNKDELRALVATLNPDFKDVLKK